MLLYYGITDQELYQDWQKGHSEEGTIEHIKNILELQ